MSFNRFNIRPKVSASLVFLLFFQFAFAQQDFSKVNDWVNTNLTDLGGRAVLMIYKDGKFVYTQNFNNLTKAQQNRGKIKAKVQGKDVEDVLQDYTTTTRERIASSSKWLTAALLMTYIDENKVRLTDSVGKFLPVMTKYGKGGIKVWQCLNHTTGIKSGGLRDMLGGMKNVKTMFEAIEQIAMLPMEGTPGKYFHYSNTGLQIVAAIIEKVSEKDFETAFKERIADPLEMKNTDFGKNGVPLAAGGAYSTPEDYMNFLIMLLNEGEFNGKRIISKALVNEMQKNRLSRDVELAYSPEEAGNWGYGFGEWIIDAPLAVSEKKDAMPVSKRGVAVSSPGLFGSFPWIDNDKKYCAFLFVYNLKNNGRHEKYRELKGLVDNVMR
ncbi:class A beta-lactamase-related serine hydrolase [Lacibacter luteus]|uniref:Class A beta-lactamase-related serine hydrolase n=1 Tax=Lacibacter luteus TaxID=2508719 RepID=A0A4Q1CMN0_9BACT|nr:serine hydrolase domain-containing protein [Lacibacter luteus]RXK62328.1 class A beta-lactamase-related serine hydrolase [Lacibacter luteus]